MEDEHPAYTQQECGTIYLFSMLLAEATVLVLFNEVLFEENHLD